LAVISQIATGKFADKSQKQMDRNKNVDFILWRSVKFFSLSYFYL